MASITMVGQFPHGIDIHTRNLLWCLEPEDHIYIVTLPNFIKEFNLRNSARVTYIPFSGTPQTNLWVNFWQEFPTLIKEYDIRPEWFLFMEQDIWFHDRPQPPEAHKTIRSFLPRGDYRNVLLNGEVLQDRVWEGAQVVHKSVVLRACNFGINFSFVKRTFLDEHRDRIEKKFGGPIRLSMYGDPDTMDEFNLYCAIIERIKIEHDVKAIHLRGPESVHRRFPEIYYGATTEQLEVVQKKVKYLDLSLVASCYYVVGLWDNISHLSLTDAKTNIKKEYAKLARHAHKWMTDEEICRIEDILRQFRACI